MAKKIVDETLKFTIVVNGNEAQKEYGKLNRANKKLIEDTKDLEAQAAKLRKANKQSSAEYKQLTSTIDANNKKVKEAENRMSQLTKEIGINELTQRQLRKESNRLRGILSNLTPGTDKWKQYNKQLQAVKNRQANLREEMRATETTLEDQEKALGQLTIGFGQFFTGLKTGNYTDASEGLRTITGGLKTATKAAWAFVATPIGAFLATLAGIGLIVKEWVNYNESIKESIILTEQITKLTGAQAEAIRLRNEALKETFGTDEQETLETATALVTKFKVSYEDAFNAIEDGLVKGQIRNKEYFDSLDEYSVFFAKMGYDVNEFKDIVSTGYDLKFYKDKLPDALKEASIEISTESENLKKELESALGKEFSDNLFTNFKNGTLQIKDVLSEIDKEIQKQGVSQTQAAKITERLFISAGEDAGGALQIFNALTVASQNANRALTPLEQSTRDLADANLELATAKDQALKSEDYISFTRDLEVFWTKTKTLFYQGVNFVVKTFTQGSDFFISTFVSLVTTAQSLPTILKQGLKDIATAALNTLKTFGGLSDVLDRLMALDFSGAKQAASNFKENFSNAFNDVKKSATGVADQILNTQKAAKALALQQLQDKRAGNAASVLATDTQTPGTTTTNTDPNTKAEEASKKAVEAAIKKKQAVQDALDKFDEEQAIRDQLKQVEKDQQAEEEEIIRKQLEFEKLEEDAAGDLELLAQIEETKQLEIQAIRDRYDEERLQKKIAADKKLAEEEEKFKQKLATAENNFQKAKSKALQLGLSLAADALGKESALGKAMFLFQKAQAIADIIRETSKANTTALSNEIMIPAFLPPGIPNPIKAASVAATTKQIATNKINAGINIASIAASSIKGFEEGLYPVTRQQDGKQFNAQYSNNTATRLVNDPTILVGERPEMIIDPDTLNRMNPSVVDYILQLAGKRPIQGFENGSYTKAEETTPTPTTTNNDAVMVMLANAVNKLVNEGVEAYVNYGIHNEIERQRVQKQYEDTINQSNN